MVFPPGDILGELRWVRRVEFDGKSKAPRKIFSGGRTKSGRREVAQIIDRFILFNLYAGVCGYVFCSLTVNLLFDFLGGVQPVL